LAFVAAERTEVHVPQNFARSIDREVRENRRLLDDCTPSQAVVTLTGPGEVGITDGDGQAIWQKLENEVSTLTVTAHRYWPTTTCRVNDTLDPPPVAPCPETG
jgi:hypothetical protein